MPSVNLLEHLSVIRDPRIERNKKHDLSEMLFVAVCAALSGAPGWSGIVEFAEAKEEWLRRFVRLDNWIPVDDTFVRVLSRVAPQALQACLVKWTQALCERGAGEVIAINGKTVRRSHDRRQGRGPLHWVRAWATEAGLALGQVATEVKSNEIVAIQVLLSYRDRWAGLQIIAMVEGERHVEGKVSIERRYFIASLAPVAEPIARAVRAYWQVENGCHWVLDMALREDDSQIRRGYGAESFSTLRHFALNLVKRQAPKLSVRKKRIRAGFSDTFREELLDSIWI